MHKYFFPLQDTYITNYNGLESLNFGLTEILKIGAVADWKRVVINTTSESYDHQYFDGINITSFSGSVSGSFVGYCDIFLGTISGSHAIADVVYFSGSLNNTSSVFSGSIISSSAVGRISGSLVSHESSSYYVGTVSNLNGCFHGTITGNGQVNLPNTAIIGDLTSYRSLIKFDLTSISQSIVNNSITTSSFFLNLKVCQEIELPLNYSVYAFAVSQSWDMGNGYFSDGGSTQGASWIYRNGQGNSKWVSTTASLHNHITLQDTASVDGGGTWYSASICSQSFNYTTSDVRMDITPIVKSWLNGSIPNNGIILLASSEIAGSEDGFIINFFSENTNTIYSPFIDLGWDNSKFITSSIISTSSYGGIPYTASIGGNVSNSSVFSNLQISGTFSGSAGLLQTIQLDGNYSASGIVGGIGLNGNILNIPIVGTVSGVIGASSSLVTGSCGLSYMAQPITASFLDGVFSGSRFTGYYTSNEISRAILAGNYPLSILNNSTIIINNLGTTVNTSSYYTATMYNSYFTSNLLGTISTYSTSSASFTGYFTDGWFNGQHAIVEFNGDVLLAGGTTSSSYLTNIGYRTAVDVPSGFTVNVRDLNTTYQRGNVAKIFVSGHVLYPPKTFITGSQFDAFITPSFLPTQSYYAIKDNITNEFVIPFDDYSKLSFDYYLGNYFEIDTNCLFPDREYQILVKIIYGNDIYTLDTGKKFRIVK